MARLIFILLAFILLNKSVDIDNLVLHSTHSTKMDDFDDIDSLVEFVIETIAGDNHFLSEDPGDDNNTEQHDSDNFVEIWVCASMKQETLLPFPATTGHFSFPLITNTICSGFYGIVSPPPDPSV